MHYIIENTSSINIRQGETIEVLESYYHKFSDQIFVRKLRVRGKTHYAMLPQSSINFSPLKEHEGYVKGIKVSDFLISLNISVLVEDDDRQSFIRPIKTKH